MNAKLRIGLVLFFGVFVFGTAAVYAAGTDSSSWGGSEPQKKISVSAYDQGVEAHKSGDYQKARTLFDQALKTDKDNPDILNMLAHTQLKLGMIDESLENYKKALKLRPKFPEAREYLGEAYIQAALREIETLKSYGMEAVEELDDLVNEFKKAADAL